MASHSLQKLYTKDAASSKSMYGSWIDSLSESGGRNSAGGAHVQVTMDWQFDAMSKLIDAVISMDRGGGDRNDLPMQSWEKLTQKFI